VELASWAVFSSKDLLTQLVCERMIADVAKRTAESTDTPELR
jgi:hypothetical protein